MRVRASVSQADAVCDSCGQPMAPRMIHVIDRDSPMATLPLAALGVPDEEILQLVAGDLTVFVQLARVVRREACAGQRGC
jgi:hypothetical protein